MRKRTVLRLLPAILIVWILRPVFEIVIPFPTDFMFYGIMDPSDAENQKIIYVIRFIFWIFLIQLVLKMAMPVLSLIVPSTHGRASTKPFRRLQALMNEFKIWGVTFLFIALGFGIPLTIKHFNTRIEQEHHAMNMEEKTLYKNLEISASEGNEYIETIKQRNKRVNPNRLPPKSAWQRIKDGFRGRNNYLYLYYIPPNAYFETPGFSDPIKGDKKPNNYQYKSIFDLKAFNELREKHFGLTKRYYDLLAVDILDLQTREDVEAHYRKKAQQNTWQEFLYNPLTFLAIGFSSVWLWACLGAFLVYGISLYKPARYQLALWYETRMLLIDQIRAGRNGSARFAGLFEEIATQFKKSGHYLFYGKSLFNPWLQIGSKDSRHMTTFGGTRGGKGKGVVIPNLLRWPGSTIVIDPKGTSVHVTAQTRRAMGQDILVLDPFELTLEPGACHSFLQHLDPESMTIREDLGIIAESLVIRKPNAKDNHWDDGAKSVITALLAFTITPKDLKNPELPHHAHPSIYHIRELLTLPPDKQTALWANMASIDFAGGIMRDVGNRIQRGIKTEEITNILSNVDTHTSWLSAPAIKKTLAEFDEYQKPKDNILRFSSIKEKPTTIYLVLPPELIDEHKRFLRLFINLAINQMSVGGKSKIPVLFLMDEFASLGPMSQVERAMGLMAGFNMILHPILQDLSQLKRLYPNGYHTFINNSRAVQVFATADNSTCHFVSEHLGERALDQVPLSFARRTTAKMRTPSEVRQDISGESGRQYILRADKPPLLIERVDYYDSAPVPLLYKLSKILGLEKYSKWLRPIFTNYGIDPDHA